MPPGVRSRLAIALCLVSAGAVGLPAGAFAQTAHGGTAAAPSAGSGSTPSAGRSQPANGGAGTTGGSVYGRRFRAPARPTPRPVARPPARSTPPAPTPGPVRDGRFPVAGPHSYPGADGRFGAQRPGRIHQGQDISAAEGTPLVSVRTGTVIARGFQAAGAGNYVVIAGATDNRSYVFMHMRTGSVLVENGSRVVAGQRIGDVGSTGRSSGAHLHFEIWSGRWFGGGRPIDPLPDLLRWDRYS